MNCNAWHSFLVLIVVIASIKDRNTVSNPELRKSNFPAKIVEQLRSIQGVSRSSLALHIAVTSLLDWQRLIRRIVYSVIVARVSAFSSTPPRRMNCWSGKEDSIHSRPILICAYRFPKLFTVSFIVPSDFCARGIARMCASRRQFSCLLFLAHVACCDELACRQE
jgi:hypothetical protein